MDTSFDESTELPDYITGTKETPPKFQAAEKDLIREVPFSLESPLDLPSVPSSSPSDILKNSASLESESKIITYPDPPGTVYVIPITASQELRLPSTENLEKIPDGTVYFIPITRKDPEDEAKNEENESVTLDDEENDVITYPDPPGSYYFIPIVKGSGKEAKLYASQNIVKYASAMEPHVYGPHYAYYPNYYQPFYYPYTQPYSYYPPYYYNHFYHNPGMAYHYRPQYLEKKNVPDQASIPKKASKSNYPAYLLPSYCPAGTHMAGIQHNSAPNEPTGPSSYLSGRAATDPGTKLFEDMLSRADKTDDGGLTFEEFKDYFQDEILSDSELLCLFNTMDTNNNGNIELSELVEYFSGAFAPYRNLFGTLASVNGTLSSSLSETFQSYPNQQRFEQFRTRVYLKETLRQIDSMRNSVSSALQSCRAE